MKPEELDRLLKRLEGSMEACHRVHHELLETIRLLAPEEDEAVNPVPPKAEIPHLGSGRTVLDTRGAAEVLHLSPRTLEQWRVRGGGPPFMKIGGGVRYDSDDLQTWLATRRRRSTSDPGRGA